MPLAKDAYRALEDIVGTENISQDPAILDSYAFQYLAETFRPEQSKFMPRPEAAVLPGSTEEVQAIVKACNRFRIKYHAYSTGWFPIAAPQTEGVIQLDMRRMNHILEIDEKNMFAVIEPYVIAATLQAEAMKVGLNCNIIGAGASHSPLASATSLGGHGPASLYIGHNTEVLLALEWVTPSGDILRTGSLDAGCGWFCGEGIGPSLRGLVRGGVGALGGLGVFTKCAIKLSAWPGPAEMPVEGTIPALGSPLPENFRAYSLAFPSWQALADAYYKVYDSEIGYCAHRQFNMLGGDLSPAFWMLYNDPTKTLDDLDEFARKPEIKKLTEEMRYCFQIILAGMSLGDIEYQEKVLTRILDETGGWKVAAMAEPDMQKFTLLYLIRLPSKTLNFAYGGSFHGIFAQFGTPDFMIDYAQVAMELLKKHQDTGLLAQCGGDAMMGCVGGMGGGTYSVLEEFMFWDPHDKESLKEAVKFCEDAATAAREHGWPAGLEKIIRSPGLSEKERKLVLQKSKRPAPYHWQWKIKQVFDPGHISDTGYEALDELPK